MIVDPYTQFPNIQAINWPQKEARVASALKVENRTRRVKTASGRTKISAERGKACSSEEYLLEFNI